MKKYTGITFLFLIICSTITDCHYRVEERGFITVENGRFYKNGKPYHFIGANYWYGACLAADTIGGDRDRLIRELDFMKAKGIDNLRVMVGAEGPDNQPFRVTPALIPEPGKLSPALLRGLDVFLDELKKRDMHAVLFLTNNWEWSGGMAQYVSWNGYGEYPNPNVKPYTWADFFEYQPQFYRCAPCKMQFKQFMTKIIERTNSVNGVPYKNDPTIMAWELANEPRPMAEDHFEPFTEWIFETARFIKELDSNHLVATGNEGEQGCSGSIELFEMIHSIPEIDYITIHIWLKNWGWYRADDAENTFPPALENVERYLIDHLKVAEKLRKPLVVEEFGLARDNEQFHPGTPVTYRDRYYTYIFEKMYQNILEGGFLSGCNFWAFGGYAQPIRGQIYWKPGDPYSGDPPQEEQGLNSVFASDSSTLLIISNYNRLVNRTP